MTMDRRDAAAVYEKTFDERVGKLLRAGVTISAAVVFAGGIWYLTGHGHEGTAYQVFKAEPERYRSLLEVLKGPGSGSRSLIQLGLLLLVLTPIARVGLCLVTFAVGRDRIYVAVTAIVLSILLFTLIY